MFQLGIPVGSDVMNRYIQPSCFTGRCDLCDRSDVCLAVVVYAQDDSLLANCNNILYSRLADTQTSIRN